MRTAICRMIMFAGVAVMPDLHAADLVKAPQPTPCEAVASRELDFTAPHARDVLEASARGVHCETSVVTIVLRQADGRPLAAFALPLLWLHDTVDPASSMLIDTLKGLLQAYVTDAQLDVAGTTIPNWKRREPTPGFSQGMELTTPLDRTSYANLRRTKPNMLCMADAHDMGVCYVWDARAGTAEVMLRR